MHHWMKLQNMLVEFPMDRLPEDTIDLIYQIRLMNLVPVSASPERYRYIIYKPEKNNDSLIRGMKSKRVEPFNYNFVVSGGYNCKRLN